MMLVVLKVLSLSRGVRCETLDSKLGVHQHLRQFLEALRIRLCSSAALAMLSPTARGVRTETGCGLVCLA